MEDYCNDYACINITGPSNGLCNNTYTYTAEIIGVTDECSGMSFSNDKLVYLSYVGSTITNHDGPSSVIIPSGRRSVSFNITVEDNQVGILIVSGT